MTTVWRLIPEHGPWSQQRLLVLTVLWALGACAAEVRDPSLHTKADTPTVGALEARPRLFVPEAFGERWREGAGAAGALVLRDRLEQYVHHLSAGRDPLHPATTVPVTAGRGDAHQAFSDRMFSLLTLRRVDPDGSEAEHAYELAVEEVKSVLALDGGSTDWISDLHASQPAAVVLLNAQYAIGMAFAYDWMHSTLRERDPDLLVSMREALYERSVRPFHESYHEPARWNEARAARGNQLAWVGCGAVLAALAIEPDLTGEPRDHAARLIEHVVGDEPGGRDPISSVPAAGKHSIRTTLESYGPNGGAWFEGPAYWEHTTRSLVLLLSALDTVGRPFSLEDYPGFLETWLYRAHASLPVAFGAVHPWYAHGDAWIHGGRGFRASAELLWLAAQQRNEHHGSLATAWASLQLFGAGPAAGSAARGLWWYREPNEPSAWRSAPLDHHFGGTVAPLAAFRSAWLEETTDAVDPRALAVYVKGGENGLPHGHHDVGSFAIVAGGHVWAEDLGADSYSSVPAYFGGGRYAHLRTSSHGHNVPTFTDEPLRPGDRAGEQRENLGNGIGMQFRSGAVPLVVLDDLSPVYDGEHVRRGIALMRDRSVVALRDELMSDRTYAHWNWYTRALPTRERTTTGQWLSLRIEDQVADLFIRVLDGRGRDRDQGAGPGQWTLTYDLVGRHEVNPSRPVGGRCVGAPTCAEIGAPEGLRRVQIRIRAPGTSIVVAEFHLRQGAGASTPLGSTLRALRDWPALGPLG